MDLNTTRRQLLRVGTSAAAYAAGAAIVAGGVAVATQAKGEASVVSPALAQLLADHTRADSRLDRFYAEEWNPACDAHSAEYKAVMARGEMTPAEDDRLHAKYQFDRLRRRESGFGQPVDEADDGIRAFRCNSVADLRAKLVHMEGQCLRDEWGSQWVDTIFADLDGIEGRA